MTQTARVEDRPYLVAFTLAGEQLEFARALHDALVAHEGIEPERIFFYPDRQSELVGQNGVEVLSRVYREESELVVPFLSREYSEKEWTQFEWDQVLDLVLKRERKRLFPLRFPGFEASRLAAFSRTTFFYSVGDSTAAGSVAREIKKRLIDLGVRFDTTTESTSLDEAAILYASDSAGLEGTIERWLKKKERAGKVTKVVPAKVDQRVSLAKRRLKVAKKCGTIFVLGTPGLVNTSCGVSEFVREAIEAGRVVALLLAAPFDVNLLFADRVNHLTPQDGFLCHLRETQRKKLICEVVDKIFPCHEIVPPNLHVLRGLLRGKGVEAAIQLWRGQRGWSAEDIIRDGPFDLILAERLVDSIREKCYLKDREAVDLAQQLIEAMLPLWGLRLPDRGFLGAELAEASNLSRPVCFEKEDPEDEVRGASAYEMLPPRGFQDAPSWARQFRLDQEMKAPEIADLFIQKVSGNRRTKEEASRKRDRFVRALKKYRTELELRVRMNQSLDGLEPPAYLIVAHDGDGEELIPQLRSELGGAGVYSVSKDLSRDLTALEIETSFLELSALRDPERGREVGASDDDLDGLRPRGPRRSHPATSKWQGFRSLWGKILR